MTSSLRTNDALLRSGDRDQSLSATDTRGLADNRTLPSVCRGYDASANGLM
jgi:hypothetical protein